MNRREKMWLASLVLFGAGLLWAGWRMNAMLDRGGADVMAIDESGNTPLHNAARRTYVDAVRLLLEYGADPGALNHVGATPADMVRYDDHARPDGIEVLRLLREGTKSLPETPAQEPTREGRSP